MRALRCWEGWPVACRSYSFPCSPVIHYGPYAPLVEACALSLVMRVMAVVGHGVAFGSIGIRCTTVGIRSLEDTLSGSQ